MMSRRLQTVVPTLMLLGFLPGAMSAATAGSATERDAQFEATRSLIDREYRLPAKRQLEDFTKAGYADAVWHLKVLTWFYADRFRVSSPDAAEKSALTSQAAALEGELKAAAKDGKLPKNLQDMVSGSGQILRLVNDILSTLDPDRPEPILGAKAYTAEQRAALNQAVKVLIDTAGAMWTEGLAKVKANAKNEETGLGGDQKDPKIAKLLEGAVDIRLEVVRSQFLARKALREVAERGDAFGVDPAPAREALKAFVTTNLELLQEWDYNWGDYHAYLHAFIMELASDGPRFKVAKANLDEVEADMLKTVAMDVEKDFGSGAVAEDIRTLQARSWANLFVWYRDLGRDLDQKNWQRGAEHWDEFKELTKKGHFRLDHRNAERATEVARVYLNAGRLFLAKGDKRAALALFSAVAGNKKNSLAPYAQEWIARSGGASSGGGDTAVDWGSQPMAEEPASVLATASAYIRTSGQLGDATQARNMLMTAAVSLRNGILGLSSASFAENADEVTPELWFRYAFVLGKLDLRWHAALASQEGLRHIKARLADTKAGNPWKTRDNQWTAAGGFVGKLAKNAIIYAQNLLQRSKGAGVSALFDETVTLVNAVCPEEGGKNIDRIQVIIRIQDGDYDGAVDLARAFQKKYPDSFYDGASLINTARIAKFTKTTDANEIKRFGDEMLADAGAVAEKAKGELVKATDPDLKRTLNRAIREVQRLKATILNKQGKSAEVMAMLDATYWASPPADEEESRDMLKILCDAAYKYYRERVKDEAAKRDPAVLLADWPKLEGAYTIWRAQKARLTTQTDAVERMGNSLGSVFQSIPLQIRAMREKPGAPAELGAIETAANRAFADLAEAAVGANKPDLALYVGNVLWDLGEHVRAVRLYEIFLASIAKDPEISALRDNPKDVLAPLDTLLNARPEFRQKWAEISDLLIDDPQLTEKILTLDLPPDQWGEKKRDFSKALAAIRSLRGEVVKARVSLGATFAAIDSGLDKIEKTTAQLGREMAVVGNLAVALSEQGHKAKANALYERLIAYDPTDPTYLAAAVELTLDRLKRGDAIDSKAIESTLVKAARVRDAAPEGSTTYWLAKIQVLELQSFLKNTLSIDKAINFDQKNQSTIADSLQLLPRNPRDDKRVRRSRNTQATELCRRYLEIFKLPGITVKPSFVIDTVEIDGKPSAVFSPVDGITFTAHKRELADGSITWFLWETGKEPPPEPEEAPAPAPTPTATPVAPAPAPAQPDKAQEKKP